MQNVADFITLLGENHYLDFIIEPSSEEVDYDKHFVLVHYQDKKYYEETHEHIQIRQNEIINNLKFLFQKSISDIYIEVSKKNNEEIEKFLSFNIEAVKVKLNILKNDFYIDNHNSRYYSVLYDDADTQTLETFYSRRNNSTNTTNLEIKNIIQKLNSDSSKNLFVRDGSAYFIEFHIQRFKVLSFLPFKLFQIAHHFIAQLNKINVLHNMGGKKQPTEAIVDITYFESFLKLLDDSLILKKSTAIGVMVDFKRFIQEIKSEILIVLQSKGENRNDYLDYLINEIEKQDYIKNADIAYIQKWLGEYSITIEEIMNMNYRRNPIANVIDYHYNDMEPFSPEKDKACIVQTSFRDYFCKYYADELIKLLNSFKTVNKSIPVIQEQNKHKPFNDQYLNTFCKEISDEKAVKECCFDLVYESIVHFVPYLETEIIENLLLLDNSKRDDYLNFAIDKIKKTSFVNQENTNIDKWLKKYNVSINEFPKFNNTELNEWLNKYYNSTIPYDFEEREAILDIQIDFYCYAAMIEGNKMITFLESKRTTPDTNIKNIKEDSEDEDIKQLTLNQAVILLDKLGVFTDDKLEGQPNTKKARIISLLLGKNEKNTKTAIEKLELKKSELGSGYQRDIDKIERILNNLE